MHLDAKLGLERDEKSSFPLANTLGRHPLHKISGTVAQSQASSCSASKVDGGTLHGVVAQAGKMGRLQVRGMLFGKEGQVPACLSAEVADIN